MAAADPSNPGSSSGTRKTAGRTRTADTRRPGPDDAETRTDGARDRDAERRRRRALFLRELREAKELRARVAPRRARAARMRQEMRMRTFRW